MALIKDGTGTEFKRNNAGTGGFEMTLLTETAALVFKKPIVDMNIRIPNQRLTAAVAAGSLIWAMRYNGSNKLRVKSGFLLASFDGTAAATTQGYQLVRFSGANTTGGTAIQPVRTDTSGGAIPSIDARFNYAAALGVTSVVLETEYPAEWGVQRQVSANQNMPLPGRNTSYSGFIDLRNGEGLAIRLSVAAVIGDSLGGHFELHEVGVND